MKVGLNSGFLRAKRAIQRSCPSQRLKMCLIFTLTTPWIWQISCCPIGSPLTKAWDDTEYFCLTGFFWCFMSTRPATCGQIPHAVLTPTASICHASGGYYLTTSCLRQTCHGYWTTFMLSTLFTNSEVNSKAQLLFRKLAFLFWDAYTHKAARGCSFFLYAFGSDVNLAGLPL